jgi:hypothetical protein
MTENGLYKIKDEYFSDFPHEKHIHNKAGRPFYYAVKDTSGVYWLIPMSSQVENFRQKIDNVEQKRGVGNCIAYHIGVIMGKPRVFRICDMLPVTARYIDGEFTLDGRGYVVKDKALITAISRKARDFIKQMELGRMYSQVGALEIREALRTGMTLFDTPQQRSV